MGTHTDEHNKGKQWWMVDLKRDAVIQRIVVWNRSDCCQERLSNSEIQILDKSGAIVAKKVISNVFSGKEKFEFNFSSESPSTIGSAVKVQQLESGGVLSLAEVQVFGTMVGTNLALNVIASQSYTGYDGSASRAIDGNIDGHYGHNSVTHTDEHNKGKQWWMVDLKRDAVIQRIVVWNRS